jgi:ubiquinone/menaquinone biosynthesis C-methylase UbiE
MQFHPESPNVAAPELSRLAFIADLKRHLYLKLGAANRRLYEKRLARPGDAALAASAQAARREEIRADMEKEPYFQGWSSAVRASQDLMWRYVDQTVEANRERLESRFATLAEQARGRVETDPDLEIPDYLAAADIHRMPGSYHTDRGPRDLRAGALYDLGGAVYQLGIGNSQGALLNDTRGQTLVAHLAQYYPTLAPARILDMGCSAGHNTVPVWRAFPDAEVHAIDLGAPMVRYAFLRAEGLGARIHFSQQNAERTRFPDASFDLVLSQIVLHETSPAATRRIFEESFRLLRPGGVVVHLEVPIRYEHSDVFDQFIRSWEEYYNNEPNISGAAATDFRALATEVGFERILTGYQSTPGPKAEQQRPEETLSERPKPGRSSWYIVSATR